MKQQTFICTHGYHLDRKWNFLIVSSKIYNSCVISMFPGSPPPTHELRMCVQARREAVDELVVTSTEQAVATSLPLTNLTKLYYPN